MKRLPFALLCIILLSFSNTFADTEKLYFDIPSQAAKTALEKFVELTETSMISTAENLGTLRTKSVIGTYTIEEALDIMLQGSGLEYTRIGDTTISIKKRQTKEGYPTQIKENHPVSLKVNHNSAGGKDLLPTKSPSDVKVQASARSGVKSRQEFTLEDIVVTASRVESLASKTPVAVTAVTGDQITQEGLSNPLMLENAVPNLSIVRTFGLQITIRGVTSNDNTEKGDPSVAFMIDDVYIARPNFQEVNFYDTERVEVLRGPQGTLYGRNTTAGVINVITNKPKDRFETAFNTTIGDYGTIQGDGMINVPISDALAFRGAVSYQRRDHYIDMPNATQSHDPFKDNLSFRLQTLYDINDNASLLLKAEYGSLKGSSWVRTNKTIYDTTDPQNPRYIGGISSEELLTDPTISDKRSDFNDKVWGLTAELNWDFGPMALTYLASYHDIERDNNMNMLMPWGSVQGIMTGDYWQSQQEIRLATSGDGAFQGQIGAYYFKEKSGISALMYEMEFADVYGFQQDPTINESYAFFGQGTYSLTLDLRLTTGIRYSRDDKNRLGATVIVNPVYDPGAEIRQINAAARTFSKTTWRLGLDYDLNDRTLLYGSVATGYKAGGFNDGCEEGIPGCNQPRSLEALYYDPETLTAYEVGTKALFSDKVSLNGSAFYYDYDNLQLSSVVDLYEGGGQGQVTRNAAKAEIKGVEIESVFMPITRNRMNAAVTWLDAAYKNYWPLGDGTPPRYAGKSLDRSPEFTVLFGYRYRYPLANGDSIEAALNFRWSDSYVMTVYDIPAQYEQPSYHKTDLSLTYTNSDGSWYFQLFGKNLEDEVTVTYMGPGGNSFTPGDPRTYGARAGLRF